MGFNYYEPKRCHFRKSYQSFQCQRYELHHFSYTLFTRSYSHIDVSLMLSGINSTFNWKTHSDLSCSDYFPIIISLVEPKIINRRSRWIVNDSNWIGFQNDVDLNIPNSVSGTNSKTLHISNSIFYAAIQNIPRTSTKPKRIPVPWWNDEISNARKERIKALKIFDWFSTNQNLSIFKRKRSICKHLISEAKRKSWSEYVQSIDLSSSSSTDVWRKIKSINGKFSPNCISSLLCNNSLVHNLEDILKGVGSHYERSFSDLYYPPSFLSIKLSSPAIILNSCMFSNIS